MATVKIDKEKIKFQIEQLRADNTTFAVQAAAFNLAAFIFIAFGYSLIPIPTEYAITASAVIFVLAVGFTIYMIAANFLRFRKIRQLEKKI